MSTIVVRADIFYQKKLGHVPVNVGPRVWDKDGYILLPLEVDPYTLSIGALAPSITFQGVGGSCELIGLGSGNYVVYVTLQVLS